MTKPWKEIVGEISADDRERIEAMKRDARAEHIAHNLGELRAHMGLTQAALAGLLDKSQPSVSAMESRTDHHLGTIISTVDALGGHLQMVAVFEDQRVVLDFPEPADT